MKCHVPGCTRDATEVHHIYSRGRFGSHAHVLANEFLVCAEHHRLTDDSWHVAGRETFAKRHNLEGLVLIARKAVAGY